MRNGPLVHRHAHVSRSLHSAPSPLERFAAINALSDRRPPRTSPATSPLWESARLNLGSRLPINLRDFLARQLGPAMRIESDAIVAINPNNPLLMRDLARAIRKYSAERARQVWSECAIGVERLRSEFFRAPAVERCPVILCLRCSCIGAGPLDEHGGPNCLPVNLDSAMKDFAEAPPSANAAPDAILVAIENFRMARDAARLPHYDLDCFRSADQLVFTWRPLPSGPRA